MRTMTNMLATTWSRASATNVAVGHQMATTLLTTSRLLMLLKTSPDKVAEAVVHIEQMRARQQQEVAIKRGAQAGAAIPGVVPTPIP